MNNFEPLEEIVTAISEGNNSKLKAFIAAGGDSNSTCRNRSLIHWAAQESNAEALQLLLSQGANPETTDDEGHFPLYQAAAEGNLRSVRLLVEAGASINRICDSGGALSIACAYEHTDVVRYLISMGADPDLPDKVGDTARSIAENYQSPELLHALKPQKNNR